MAQRVRVGDVLSLQRRAVAVELSTEYQEIGIRSFGRGIFHKDPISGADLGSKRVFRIEPGDLVISNVFAWEGAIAVASDAEAGTIGSHRFMTFVPADDRIDCSWAAWYFRSEPGLEMIRRASPGSAGRNRTLAIERFESLEIPLLPIEVQRAAAGRLGKLQSAALELGRQSTHASALIESFAVSASARPDLTSEDKVRDGWRRVTLGSVMQPGSQPVPVEPDESYPNVGIYSFGRGLFPKTDIQGSDTSAKVLYRIRAGQFIYSRLFAFEGAYGSVSAEFEGYYVSNEFPAFDTDPEQLDAEWLASYLRSPVSWADLGGASKGLGLRRQRVPVEAVLEYQIWLPPIARQHTMIAAIRRVEQYRKGRASAERRIASLVPAALSQVFQGSG